MSATPALARAHRLLALLGSLCALLAGALAVVLLREAPAAPGGPVAPDDPARRQAVADLVSGGGGVYDSHPDAAIGHLLQPGLVDRQDYGQRVDSNSRGMREREWADPKPAGLLRVVLLGDSFIYGMGVAAEQRCGVLLERELQARAALRLPVEVLHLGIVSWDVTAQAAYLRRQLSRLQPDLVLHHVVPNDLDDTAGVRGFGAPGRFAPRHPERGDTLVSLAWGRWNFDPTARGLLPWGQDGESRARIARLGDELQALSRALDAAGCGYELIVNWNAYQVVAGQSFARRVPAERVHWLSWAFYRDPAFRISEGDEHWNPDGHRRLAEYLYGLIRARGLLPGLQLAAWPAADASYAELHGTGLDESARLGGLPAQLERQQVGSVIDLRAMTRDSAGQVYGGIDKDGFVGPWAAVVLARGAGDTLALDGAHLDRPELDGALIRVEVDEVEVARLVARAGQRVALRVELPAALDGRAWVAVRLVSDDFVYDGADLRRLVCLRLERLAIE